jgi:hypothetical protein
LEDNWNGLDSKNKDKNLYNIMNVVLALTIGFVIMTTNLHMANVLLKKGKTFEDFGE